MTEQKTTEELVVAETEMTGTATIVPEETVAVDEKTEVVAAEIITEVPADDTANFADEQVAPIAIYTAGQIAVIAVLAVLNALVIVLAVMALTGRLTI